MSLPGAQSQEPSALSLLGDTGQRRCPLWASATPALPPHPAANLRVRNQSTEQPVSTSHPWAPPEPRGREGGEGGCPQVTTGLEGLGHTQAFLFLTHTPAGSWGWIDLPSSRISHPEDAVGKCLHSPGLTSDHGKLPGGLKVE